MITCKCGGATRVKDSRPLDDGIWRQRQCKTCKAVLTTFEQLCVTKPSPRGKPKGSTKTNPIQPAVRRISPAPPVVVTRSVRSQPPGPRVADPVVQEARSRMEDMRILRALNNGVY